jgi:hypothetical protein
VFCVFFRGRVDDHGVRLADTARALAWWRHLGASHEATKTLHQAMCLALYRPGSMAIEIAVEIATFFHR